MSCGRQVSHSGRPNSRSTPRAQLGRHSSTCSACLPNSRPICVENGKWKGSLKRRPRVSTPGASRRLILRRFGVFGPKKNLGQPRLPNGSALVGLGIPGACQQRPELMPVSFLTPEQERRYGRFPDEVSAEQLARYFHFDDTDRAFVLSRRGVHMRLGFAIQLGTVRFLGTFLEDPCDVPASVVGFIGSQLGTPIDGALDAYRESQWRWRHPLEIRERYGYRDFSDEFAQWRLLRWLYALCWRGTDRPSALFDQATAWLVTHKVLL